MVGPYGACAAYNPCLELGSRCTERVVLRDGDADEEAILASAVRRVLRDQN